MLNVNLDNPMKIQAVGMRVLREALGPVGMVRFIHQYDVGYGDYAKEKQTEPDISLEEIEELLHYQENDY